MCSRTHRSQEQQPMFQLLGWSLWKMKAKSWVAKSTYRVEVEGQLTFKWAGASILHMDGGHSGDITKFPSEWDVVLKMGWGALPEEDIPLVKGSLVHQVVGIVCAGEWVIHRLALHDYWGVVGDDGVVEVINGVLKLWMVRQRHGGSTKSLRHQEQLHTLKREDSVWWQNTVPKEIWFCSSLYAVLPIYVPHCIYVLSNTGANGWLTHRLISLSLRVFCL